jgi:MFS transporter, OFA family, oxalate/formate antiporter
MHIHDTASALPLSGGRSVADRPALGGGRAAQLALGVLAMMAISSPQYVWTLYLKHFQGAIGGSLAAVQVTFSILVVLQTWLAPLQGLLVERFGPRRLLGVGAALTGASWLLAARATSLAGLYASYGVLGGIGTGIVYVGVIGQMVRWFPDRRGFAAGMAAAGYGFGAVLFTFPVSESLAARGLSGTLSWFGLAIGTAGVLAAQGMRLPARTDPGEPLQPPGESGVGPRRMLASPVFWLMFGMMAMMSTGGLMVTSQMAAFAADFGVAGATVLGLAALPLAMTVDRVANGLTRPFFGWVSDTIGRENTMGLAFLLEALAVLALLAYRQDPVAFVILSGVVFFGWGEIFSLFPATLTDTFGARHATLNYGFLYMAQGVGAVFGGPMAALLHDRWGSWVPVFHVVIALDVATAALAIAVLKPLRTRVRARLVVYGDPAGPAHRGT